MERKVYHKEISDRLDFLSKKINRDCKMNLNDNNIFAENFYRDLLNLMYGWKLVNANHEKQNIAGFDLIDDEHKILIQVSSRNDKPKITESLKKIDCKEYLDYRFIYVSISKDVDDLKKKSYDEPTGVLFDSKHDILDNNALLSEIDNLEIEKIEKINDLCKREISSNYGNIKSSDLANMIRVLSEEDLEHLDDIYSPTKPIQFKIEEKIDFNGLKNSMYLIQKNNIYHNMVSRIYEEFNDYGKNKKFFVLNKLERIYYKHRNEGFESDTLLYKVIDEVVDICSKSDLSLSIEAIEECAEILVVDAFLQCKIFENPKNYKI